MLLELFRNEKLLQDPVRLRQISERIPAGRWGEPRDFAGPVVFLASDASQYVCGELLVVDGVCIFSSSSPPFFWRTYCVNSHVLTFCCVRIGLDGSVRRVTRCHIGADGVHY